MPYVRVGKTVKKKEDGKLVKVGGSKSVGMAKRYLRALYSAESKKK